MISHDDVIGEEVRDLDRPVETRSQRIEHHRHAIADVHFPSARGSIPDLLDDAQRLVSAHDGHGRAEHVLELLVLAAADAADAADLHAQDCRIVIDVRQGQASLLQPALGGLDHGEAGLG